MFLTWKLIFFLTFLAQDRLPLLSVRRAYIEDVDRKPVNIYFEVHQITSKRKNQVSRVRNHSSS